MSLKDAIRQDMAEHAGAQQRCFTCRWVATLTEEEQREMLEEIFPDLSYTGAAIVRMANKQGAGITESSVSAHRKKHL